MTHEQKPESAEFRTRGEQIDALAKEIGPEHIFYMLAASRRQEITERASSHIAEAEARGAAEQRRKYAERAEPVKWQRQNPGHGWIDTAEEDLPFYKERGFPVRPLYDRPANVATGLDISAIIRAVCELPDRSSPEDQPDMVLVTPDELRLILETAQPANVTALEDRVKELEGALSYLEDEALRFADMYPQSSDMRNSFGVFASKIKAHAAAIREGGEHG
ncbi:hypothetical protein [Asaia sp. HumB]|uniref:hypothetical protein n=1 Tax=Asaia sp. HumB TaxID=3035475 RepID=UPI0025569D9E|nr:hypothetical protein [Asaia sp. HumB]MDL2169596.1 hypothetical protein [Asaia sp. HumB]